MMAIILFLLSFIQLAFCGPLDSGCITDRDERPIPEHCHEVIGAFSQEDPTGYIGLDGHATLTIARGNCEGTLYNRKAERSRFNEAELAVDMTTNIFNKCIINGAWGRSETAGYSVRLLPADFPRREEHAEEVSSSVRLARDDQAETRCFAYSSGTTPPVPAECEKAIEGLTQSGSTEFAKAAAYSCTKEVVAGCSAFFCNQLNHEIQVFKDELARDLKEKVFKPCVENKKYGHWEPDNKQYMIGLYEAPPQK